MSDVAIFAVGSVIFVITSWATIAYGLAAAHQLRLRDLEDSPDVTAVKAESQFTEIYVRDDGRSATPAPDIAATGQAGERG